MQPHHYHEASVFLLSVVRVSAVPSVLSQVEDALSYISISLGINVSHKTPPTTRLHPLWSLWQSGGRNDFLAQCLFNLPYD